MDARRNNHHRTYRRRRGGSRSRTGCSTCKARHTRCDGQTPICSTCRRLSLQCRPPELILQSTWSIASAASSVTDKTNTSSISDPKTTQGAASEAPHGGMNSLTPIGGDASAAGSPLSASPAPSVTVGLENETADMLAIFRSDLAVWMDIFDFGLSYQSSVCRRALQSRLLLHCVCAFVAKHLSMLPAGEIWQPIAARYYGEALNQLITALDLSGPDTESDKLVASILLGSYEVLSESREPYHSHFQGSLDLIRSRSISAASVGLDRANFFVCVRHDIVLSLARRKPVQLNPADWHMPPLPSTTVSEDEMGNHLLWITGRTVNLIFGDDGSLSLRKSLLALVDEWYSRTTEVFRGVPYGDRDEDGVQKLFFAIPAAAAAMAWYHLTRILLLAEPGLFDAVSEEKVQNHANSILAIASSKITAGVRSFAILSVYFAGKHAANISIKLRAYIILKDIQTEIGHTTQDQMRSLSRIISTEST